MDAPHNVLLNALSVESRQSILSLAKHVELPTRVSLQAAETQPRYVYFITSGVASVVVALLEGGAVETNLVGNEGVTSGFALLGNAVAPAEIFMQFAGFGYRVPFTAFRALFRSSEEIRTRVLQCVQQQGLSTNQMAACNRLHDLEPRLARWLLMISDRLRTDTFQLTQEFCAEMLGSRRPTVALVAGTLQKGGFIEYSRGRVKILSRELLETVACECYEVTKRLLSEAYV